jgi:hypothetical protein
MMSRILQDEASLIKGSDTYVPNLLLSCTEWDTAGWKVGHGCHLITVLKILLNRKWGNLTVSAKYGGRERPQFTSR